MHENKDVYVTPPNKKKEKKEGKNYEEVGMDLDVTYEIN